MRKHHAGTSLCGSSLVGLFLLAVMPAAAQETTIDPAQAEELIEVERALGGASSTKDAAELNAKAAARAVLRLQQELVLAADRAAALETAVSDNQAHIEGLEAARAVSEALLATRREQLVESLAALQRLDLEPPPALLVKPQDALAAARGAMLLGTLVPELKEVADDLTAQIRSLEDLARTIIRQQEQLADDVAALTVEQRRIDELLVAKREEELISTADAKRASDRYAELAGRARSLRELLGGLESDVPTFAALQPGDATETTPPAFSTLRGRLRSPASGRIVQRFGSDDGSGSPSQGVSLLARPGGQVVSPADAEIVFAGPFRSYGNVLIITPGENYLIVIAGLAEVFASTGQQLLAGEPIGKLPADANGANGSQSGGQSARRGAGKTPVLYIEMRKDGKPVDPAPWIRFQGRPA